MLKKRAACAAVRRSKLLKNVTYMKKKLTTEPDKSLQEALSVLPPIQQVAFKSSLKQAKAKAPQGMRYSSPWIMICLLLRIASPKAYKLIRSMKLLALPTCSRLNRILAGMPCQYGFNEVALQTIKAYFEGKAENRNCGTLLIDEIKLRQSVVFNPSTYKFDGFVDFAGAVSDENRKLADHALVVMFAPLFESWVQPVASFATEVQHPVLFLRNWCLSLYSSWNAMVHVSWPLCLMVQDIIAPCGHTSAFRQSTLARKTKSRIHHSTKDAHFTSCAMFRIY
ncbi:hypothetical protein MTO96_016946 [Rhipicephalus appendiculatus]